MTIEIHGNFEEGIREILLREIENKLGEFKFAELNICVFFNFPYGSRLDDSKYNVLLLQEPKSVLPWQYQECILSKFDLVIPFSPWRAESLGISHWVFMPYRFGDVSNSWSGKRDIEISMVNAAKYSSGKTSKYGLRRSLIKKLSHSSSNFELFGWNWNASRLVELRERFTAFRSSLRAGESISLQESLSCLFFRYKVYQGGVANKSQVLQRSELTIVIENDLDYVTEKIFDAFTFLAVPVYVGPDFTNFIPEMENCIFRCKDDVTSIIETIQHITIEDIELRREAIRLLMSKSKLTEHFGHKEVWTKVANLIVSHLLESSPN